MKAKDIFKDKNFINCLKKGTYDDNNNHIEIFNDEDEIVEENIDKVIKIHCSKCWITNIEGIHIFKNLKKLSLFGNKLQELPERILELNKLKRIWLAGAFDLNNLKQNPLELLLILKQLEKNNVLHNKYYKYNKYKGYEEYNEYEEYDNLIYLKKEVYPILDEKIKEEAKKVNDEINNELNKFSFFK